jgi:hypothetical protein
MRTTRRAVAGAVPEGTDYVQRWLTRQGEQIVARAEAARARGIPLAHCALSCWHPSARGYRDAARDVRDARPGDHELTLVVFIDARVLVQRVAVPPTTARAAADGARLVLAS